MSAAVSGIPGAGARRRRGRERTGRDPCQLAGAQVRRPIRREAAFDHRDVAVVGDPADHPAQDAPPLADRRDLRQPVRPRDDHHPFLRLTDHDLERRHARLPARDRVQVDPNPGPGAVRGLRHAAGDPGRTEVGEALGEARREDLQGRLDEQLLRERVADLDRRPLRGILGAERRRGEDRRAADAVTPGRRPVQDHEVPGTWRGRAHDRVLAHEPDRHDVHEWVALVGRVEDQLAAHRRDAHAVAVAADSADDPVDEMARPGVCRVAEAERVEDSDRSRAHREDVAQDAADAGGRTLVRLDRGRVVVRLDLEGHCPAVADPHDAGVLTRAGDHVVAAGRQRPQEGPAALVGAVLAPHHAEHRELEVVGTAAEPSFDLDELPVGQPERAVERRGGGGDGRGEVRAHPATAC
jgi:hypothetical protein